MSILFKAFKLIPPNNPLLYKICRAYVDGYRAENNDDILTNGEYWLIQRVLRRCRVIFDVGANQGEFTKLALSINRQLKIHCFEPSADTFHLLAANQFPANVRCNQFALGAQAGKKTLYIYAKGGGLNSLHDRFLDHLDVKPEKLESVAIETLDSYCAAAAVEQVDFMKIDTEGFEFEVIKGARRMLGEGRVKMILFEYGGCYIDARVLLKDVFEYFQELDYDFYKLHPSRIAYYPSYDPRCDNFQYANWLVLHRSENDIPQDLSGFHSTRSSGAK